MNNDLVDALKGIVLDCTWQNVGSIDSFQPMKCYKLYAIDEIDQDILLVKRSNTEFYAIDSRCSHEGGPLDEGDIEELDKNLIVVCPWHSFDFNLKTGISSTGLKQQTYDTKIVNRALYINTPVQLSIVKSTTCEEPSLQPSSECTDKIVLKNENEKSLNYWATKILCTADPLEKCNLTRTVADKWHNNELNVTEYMYTIPEQPYRHEGLNFIDAGKIKRGKGGTLASRIALLHSLANIEQWAIDLSWDIVARYVNFEYPDKTKLPKEFYTDFIKVACDEAKHYLLLDKRLKELGSHFGALPVHNGLWESATTTKDNFLARLSIVHMVHEARGLDVHPQTRLRFLNQNDKESVELLDILYNEEITHVATGIKWFQYSCDKFSFPYIETFQDMVKKYFKGYLKPPFDVEGRTIAGMASEWYMPLIKNEQICPYT